RVDRHGEAAALELSRCGQARRTTTEHRRTPVSWFERHVGRHRSAAPGQRHAGPTEAVVVDDCHVIELHTLEDEARFAVRAQADGRPDDPIPRDTGRRQVNRGPRRERGYGLPCRRRLDHFLGAAAGEAESGERHAAGLEEMSPIHAHPQTSNFRLLNFRLETSDFELRFYWE